MTASPVDYKAAKEAFVADNLGASLWSIQLTSVTALSGYILYSVLSKRLTTPLLDYAATVLPLLLGITSLSSHPYALNAALLGCAWAVHAFRPREVTRRVNKRSQGKWLDESDSDEEPAQNVTASSSATSWPLPRLSTSSSAASSAAPSPVDPPSAMSSGTTTTGKVASPDRLETPELSRRTFKRRHSPTPSTHTHTAIDISQTPETDKFPVDNHPDYPPHPRARHHNGTSGSTVSSSTTRSGHLPFLSVYRAHMMIMTILCILAVDFPVFPRSQGKCEDFGSSLVRRSSALHP